MKIDELIFDWHGSIPGTLGKVVKELGLLMMAEYKLLGMAILPEKLIEKPKLPK